MKLFVLLPFDTRIDRERPDRQRLSPHAWIRGAALSQALQDTCGLYALSDEQTARFLMSFALRLGRLRQSLLERNKSTELEHQLMEACGLLCPLTLRPEG